MTGAKERNLLYGLYKPNVGKGNYQADVSNRGWNKCLAEALKVLGLDSEKRIEQRFKVMDEQEWDRSQECLDAINERIRREKAAA